MGKSKNASYVDKSNFQLLKDKLKEKKRVNQKLKSDVKEKHCESKKKTKISLWSKWLTSVRQSWSYGENRSPREKNQFLIAKSFDESVDLFQVSTDPETNAFETILEPDQTELKTEAIEYRGSLHPEEIFAKEGPVLRNDSQPNRPLKKDKTKINRDPFRTRCRSLVKNSKVANGAKEPPQNIEPLLTSALFIHKDLDKMVESAVFMEPRLPRDYAESKPSDEISQRSLRINNMRVSYKGKDKDEIIETFKTASEPSWKERKKLIHRQRLDENINYLVKQFVFLGTNDVIDFPRQKKPNNPFNHSSASTSRDLSRQVSPEILVNIKPFKEYLSDNSDSCQKSSKRSRLSERQFRLPKNRPVRAPRRAVGQKVSEKSLQPVLKSTVTLLKKTDSLQPEDLFLEDDLLNQNHSLMTLSPAKTEKSRGAWSEEASEDLTVETQSFSFWDMHKTYSKCKNFLQVEVQLESSSFQFKQKKREDRVRGDIEGDEDGLPNSSSLDEVLDSLEDGDHDLIFQKNLSQFKKKISTMPRLEIRKPTLDANKTESQKVEDKVWEKLFTLETGNHTEQKVVEITDLSLGNSVEKKIEMCRSECLNLQSELLWKSEKVLENIYLMFCESTVINQILATRVEANMFSLCQPLREVHDMQENNIVVVIRVENPMNFEETSERIKLLRESPALSQKSYLILPKQSETITMILYTNLNQRKIMEAGATFEIEENRSRLPGAGRSDETSLITFNFKETLSSEYLDIAKEIKAVEEDGNETKEMECVEDVEKKTYQTLAQVEIGDRIERRVALILNDPFYDYTARIYDKKITFLKHCRKFFSEPNVLKKFVYDRRHRSDSAVLYKTTKMASSEAQKSTSCPSRSRNFSSFSTNDFHVLCHNSNENLRSSPEEITISCRYFTGKQVTLLSAENTKANKNEKQKEMDEFEKKVQHQICNYIPRETKSLGKCFVMDTHREMETRISNFVQYSKIRACLDKVEEAFIRIKPDFDKSLAIPVQLMLKQEGEADKRITFQLRKSGANLKKELVAAINLIKGLNTSKGEAKGSSKQMSLIILFSKTKLLSKN